MRNKSVFDAIKDTTYIDQLYNKMDVYQKKYYSSIMDKSVTMVDAEAGTGKTTIAVAAGFQLLKERLVDDITYLRFSDRRSGKLGYLPGDKEAKEEMLMGPFYDAALECGFPPEFIDELSAHGIIEMTTDMNMRGRNLKRTLLIIDEAQNGSLDDLRLVLTRLHDQSKCVMIGHSGQKDNDFALIGGLIPFQVYQKHMAKKQWAGLCELPINYRGKISSWADDIEKTILELK